MCHVRNNREQHAKRVRQTAQVRSLRAERAPDTRLPLRCIASVPPLLSLIFALFILDFIRFSKAHSNAHLKSLFVLNAVGVQVRPSKKPSQR